MVQAKERKEIIDVVKKLKMKTGENDVLTANRPSRLKWDTCVANNEQVDGHQVVRYTISYFSSQSQILQLDSMAVLSKARC